MSARVFRQCDVTRALKAAQAAGANVVVRIEKTTGDLFLVPAALTIAPLNAQPLDDGDEEWEALAQRHGYG